MAEWGVSNAAPFQQIIGKLCWLNDKRAKSCPRDQDDWVRPSAETGHIGAVVWGHVFLAGNLAASTVSTSAYKRRVSSKSGETHTLLEGLYSSVLCISEGVPFTVPGDGSARGI